MDDGVGWLGEAIVTALDEAGYVISPAKKFRARADEIGKWLDANAPYTTTDQKHLDENTPERAYWHHGYRAALLDVLSRKD